jgi:hypothetical protein
MTRYVIAGFRRESADNSGLLGYYAASSGNLLPSFLDNISDQSLGFWILNPEDGSDRLSWNDGKKLPPLAA